MPETPPTSDNAGQQDRITTTAAIERRHFVTVIVCGVVALLAIPVVWLGPLWLALLLYIVGMVGMVTCGFYVIWRVTREW